MPLEGNVMQDFQKLRVWQAAHRFALEAYRSSATFPRSERFGLTAQVRRAAASVPTNIVEGTKRRGRNDFAHFLNIAEGSLAEARYLFFLARDLGFLPDDAQDHLDHNAQELARMLWVLRRRVERNDWTPNDQETVID